MNDYSPEANKAIRAGELKRRAYWPTLSRDGSLLTLHHPHRGGAKGRRNLAVYVKRELPQFQWNSKACRWEGPLTEEFLAKVLAAFTQAKEVQLGLDESLTAEDTITLTVEYQSGARIIRSNGRIVSVQRNGDEPRPPKAHISPDDAGRHLEARGYQFDQDASKWLDRPGTTFRRQRQQVFTRPAILL